MRRLVRLVICIVAALAIRGAADGSHAADPPPPIQIEPHVLEGACAARADFAEVIGKTHGDPEEASYLRDFGNYGVTIRIVDSDRVHVTFNPLPRSEDEIATGGSAVYLVDRRTGKLKEVTLDE